MTLQLLNKSLTVCKVGALTDVDQRAGFFFLSKTDEEISLVCETDATPASTLAREDGWRCFRIAGELDFSLVGILARISGLLAEGGISIFAVSTYNTDYILVRDGQLARALTILREAGYSLE